MTLVRSPSPSSWSLLSNCSITFHFTKALNISASLTPSLFRILSPTPIIVTFLYNWVLPLSSSWPTTQFYYSSTPHPSPDSPWKSRNAQEIQPQCFHIHLLHWALTGICRGAIRVLTPLGLIFYLIVSIFPYKPEWWNRNENEDSTAGRTLFICWSKDLRGWMETWLLQLRAYHACMETWFLIPRTRRKSKVWQHELQPQHWWGGENT